jgi:hypothetical protein
MKKGYLLGGLAVVGAIALFAYLKPKAPRRNSEGFFGASGSTGGCAVCYHRRDKDYTLAQNGVCDYGYVCSLTKRQQSILDAQR